MAGGSGSRLWPVSRTAKPKQFYDLLGTGRTMLQHTFDRALSLCGGAEHIRVITQARWGDLVREQLPDLPEDHLLLEPIRKQTATATYYGLLSLAGQGPSDSVVILPCDHYVTDQERFTATLQQAIEHAMERQWIQVIGVKPTRPEPNYGYVQYVQDSETETDVYKVKTFTDQPTPELANTFYRSGDFAWYTGIKVGSVQAFMDLYRRWMPDLVDAFAELADTPDRSLWPAMVAKIFPRCESASFREGILDKAEGLRLQLGDFGWGDLTYWAEIYREHDKDYFGNSVNGSQVALFDAHNNMIHITGQRIALIDGLENFIVADSPDGILVCPREKEAELRQRLAVLRRQQNEKSAQDKGSRNS
jgi:mannose-1-phosphate guanylyltransferase